MLLCFAPRALALSCLGLLAFASAASAQRAPIVYAGQGGSATGTASGADRLEGGSETSYGYGYGSSNRRHEGGVIDLRQSAAGARVTAVSDQQPVPVPVEPDQEPHTNDREEGLQPWLERERVGPPYQANGRWYVPTPEPGYSQTGVASWYGRQFHGRRTASGDVFDQQALTAAHPTLPLPSLVQVTNLENGREVIVRVNDRGPFARDRLIDLSLAAAEVLGFEQAGHTRVHVRYLGPAPRRVNAEGSPAPASPPPAQPAAPAATEEEGPRSLLPPSSAPETELAGAPIESDRLLSYAPPAPSGGYYVQVGAFSDLWNAHRVRDAVGAAGPVVVDVRHSASGAELFRVRVGPWNSVEQADAAQRELAAMGYGETILAAR